MYLAATVISLLLLSVVQAAPTKPSRNSKSKPQLIPLLPKPNPLVKKLVEFDKTCTADHTQYVKLEKALSDLYDVAEMGQHITEKDPAFNNYFIAYTWEKSPAIFNEIYGPNTPHRDDVKLVPNMAKSIMTGGGQYQKFTVKCPKLKDEPECKGVNAFVLPNVPMMHICPNFFPERALQSLSSKTFTPDGWCTPPKHLLQDFITGVSTIAHEMTHFIFIANHALELSLVEPAQHPIQWYTRDILDKPDENDTKNRRTYYHPNPAARVLKQRWDAYLNQLTDAIRNPQKKLTLHEPPLKTSDNADSYVLAFIEYYFFKRCERFKFNPNEVVLSL